MKHSFSFPEKYAIRKGKGKVLAYCTVIYDNIGIEFRDVRLIDGEEGVFAAAPFRTYEHDGKTKFADFWRAAYDTDTNKRNEAGVAFMEALAKALHAEYLRVTEGDEEDEAPRRSSAKKSTAKAAPAASSSRRSGRGPAPSVTDDGDEEDDDLPF